MLARSNSFFLEHSFLKPDIIVQSTTGNEQNIWEISLEGNYCNYGIVGNFFMHYNNKNVFGSSIAKERDLYLSV